MEQAFYDRGLEKSSQKKYAEAIKEFDRAIRVNSQFLSAYYQRGLAYFDLGDFRRAIADFNETLHLDPFYAKAHCSRGLAHLAAGNPQAALKDANRAVELDITYAQAYSLRGVLFRRLNNPAIAIGNLKKAAELYLEIQDKVNCRRCLQQIEDIKKSRPPDKPKPTPPEFWEELKNKVLRGDLREALDDCDWLLRINRQDPKTYYHRGRIYLEWGNTAAAIEDFKKAAEYFQKQGNEIEMQRMFDLLQQLRSNPPRYAERTTPTPPPFIPDIPSPRTILHHKLYRLVGNWEIAQGLVKRLKNSHPGNPEEWYWEKAIYDIERDRGR
ncbi:tetratricopeptide repeat protein [Lusitaniella coriacea LEGE 07157]|uniref:Tetratricopeptide repeat protein n=1 Tax=Lusitaniella coriacea LEGE 07157 TaxID=945747 RepID=A0A8J7DW14_9CYAN|nr:tetratricopeptide repeat protein [Lusitaniella coriacea]MBE9115616.1 tetratricopeptide repeat protein [Lusitaniella coriacea LEGE 07157]